MRSHNESLNSKAALAGSKSHKKTTVPSSKQETTENWHGLVVAKNNGPKRVQVPKNGHRLILPRVIKINLVCSN